MSEPNKWQKAVKTAVACWHRQAKIEPSTAMGFPFNSWTIIMVILIRSSEDKRDYTI